jgi:adenylate cyclase
MSDSDAFAAYVPSESAAMLYRAVGLGTPGYTRSEVARMAGIERTRSVKWWRAMGFPEVPEDVPAFADLDVEVLQRLAALTGAGFVDDDDVLRLARLLGSSFSRIAEAQVVLLEQLLASLPGADPDTTNRERIRMLVDTTDESVFDLLEQSLLYVWRRHLLAALGGRLDADESSVQQAVGFADLTGFTKLSQRLPAQRLAELVDEFERIAFDVVSAHGGRSVKFIGDETMFVAPTIAVAVDLALDLADRLREVEGMPAVHCGIAFGPTVAVGGDVFGPAVNLAARLTTIARADTIVIPRAAIGELAGRDDIETVRIRRTYDLKGIGGTRIVAVRRKRGVAAAPSSHAGVET